MLGSPILTEGFSEFLGCVLGLTAEPGTPRSEAGVGADGFSESAAGCDGPAGVGVAVGDADQQMGRTDAVGGVLQVLPPRHDRRVIRVVRVMMGEGHALSVAPTG